MEKELDDHINLRKFFQFIFLEEKSMLIALKLKN